MLTSKEMTFLLYALRPIAFENDLQGVKEQAEALRKKLVNECQREINNAGRKKEISHSA